MAVRAASDPKEIDPDLEAVLARLLAAVDDAVVKGDLRAGLRYADAAHRRATKSPEILELLGRLQLSCGQAERSIASLEAAADLRRDPALEAAVIDALVTAGRGEEAVDRLARSLSSFAVDPDDALAIVASRLLLAEASGPTGWVATSSDLHVWGEVLLSTSRAQTAIATDLGRRFEFERLARQPFGDLYRFTALEREVTPASVHGLIGDTMVIGASAAFPPAFNVDGRCFLDQDEVRGWAAVDWAPRRAPKIVILDDFGRERMADVDPRCSEFGRYSFRIELDETALNGRSLRVSVEFAEGVRQDLPDSPVLLRPYPAPAAPPRQLNAPRYGSASERNVSVIIPVYQGLAETLECIQSVRRTVGDEALIVVVDDCTPDAELAAMLDLLASRRQIVLIRNEQNLGFPAAVNRGLRVSRDRDVVILNADTRVHEGWLPRLKAAAYARADIGSVTPLTNSGSIASYPRSESSLAPGQGEEIARIAAAVNAGEAVEAPTGVGFCMYLKRECIDAVGELDARNFSKGYGEENDFCLRATRAGWRHVIAADVFVAHVGGRSFGRRREALIERNLPLLYERYPEYEDSVRQFELKDPLQPYRRRISAALLTSRQTPSVLIVSLAGGGGIERFVRRRVEMLIAQGLRPLVLRPEPATGCLRVESEPGAAYPDLVFRQDDELVELLEFVSASNVTAVEIHHFMDLRPSIIDAVSSAGIPYDVYIHDYSWLCTRVTMMTPAALYCGEPPLDACSSCGLADGARLDPGLTIPELRARSDRWLRGAREVFASSVDAKTRMSRYFPEISIEVTEWEPPFERRSRHSVSSAGTVKILVVGAIGEHKGYNTLRACAEDAAVRNLPIEFIVLGFTEGDRPLLETGRVFISGEYDEAEIDELIAREQPDVALFASMWPETWCFALTPALRADLPVLAFDIGTIAERLRRSDGEHVLLPYGSDASQINDGLLLQARRLAAREVSSALPTLDHAEHLDRSGIAPAMDVADHALRTAGRSSIKMQTDNRRVDVSGEIIALDKGIYKLSVRSASPAQSGKRGGVVLPAVRIGLAPGVFPENIEVMRGTGDGGDWLFAERDLLVVKVNVDATSLLLTSVSAENGTPLEISVERIDLLPAGRQADIASQLALAEAPDRSAARVAKARTAERVIGAGQAAGQPGPRSRGAKVMTHVRNRGDVLQEESFWAGILGEGLPIEAFAIAPPQGISPDQLEYKAITAAGVETPWITAGELCGARGASMPLAGFAIRLRGGAEAQFDCEYLGAFGSGKIVGPVTNGAPCRALGNEDHLEGIQLTIAERPSKGVQYGLQNRPAQDARVSLRQPSAGPKFSAFREEMK